MPDIRTKRVSVNFFNASTLNGGFWFEKFNQATFFNYTRTPVEVNGNITIPPGQVIGGFIYPSVLEISLNNDEVNDTKYYFNFGNTAAPNLQVMYTEYIDMPNK